MNSKPRKVINLIARLALVLSAVFSGVNMVFAFLGTNRLMPMALTMTGYLTKLGIARTAAERNVFFAFYCAALAAVVCLVFALCALLGAKSTGWLVSALIIFLVDCAGIGVLFLSNGFRSGYWFELAGHAVILVVLLVALFSQPRRKDKTGKTPVAE